MTAQWEASISPHPSLFLRRPVEVVVAPLETVVGAASSDAPLQRGPDPHPLQASRLDPRGGGIGCGLYGVGKVKVCIALRTCVFAAVNHSILFGLHTRYRGKKGDRGSGFFRRTTVEMDGSPWDLVNCTGLK